jgi:predicted DNA binding CopG/RHH family protein
MNKPTKSVPSTSIPKFANEAQERAYWESHDSTDHLDWSKAKKATLPNLKPTTKTISLRLPQHLLDSLKVAANARDVPYQSLIKVWLQTLEEEEGWGGGIILLPSPPVDIILAFE